MVFGILLLILTVICAIIKVTWKILLGVIIAFLLLGTPIGAALVWWCFGLFVASLFLNVSINGVKNSHDEDVFEEYGF